MNGQKQVPLIICFGDSLTAGYQSPTGDRSESHETPYGIFLQDRLGSQARVVVSGVCGELTGGMLSRFRRDVLDHKPEYVVILGGTNDLGWSAEPSEIMRNLLLMYEQALEVGIRPVAVTVPSIRFEGSGDEAQWLHHHIAQRRALNGLITAYCVAKGLPWVDLFAATAEHGALCLAAQYSNDGLHLTTEGYKTFAVLLHTQVFAARFPS